MPKANGEAARFSNAGLVAQAAASGGLCAQEEGDAPTVAEFHVTVYTSDVRGAGTDAPSVRLALAGDGWDSGPRELHEVRHLSRQKLLDAFPRANAFGPKLGLPFSYTKIDFTCKHTSRCCSYTSEIL